MLDSKRKFKITGANTGARTKYAVAMSRDISTRAAQKAREFDSRCLKGQIVNIERYNEGSGWFVASVLPHNNCLTSEETNDPIKMTGVSHDISDGHNFEARGGYVDSKYGLQFNARDIETSLPQDKEGLRRFLCTIDGIGEVTAKKMVKQFGGKITHILDHHPHYLNQLPRLTPGKIEKITKSWQSKRLTSETKIFLLQLGFGPRTVDKIFRTYKEETIEKVRTKPYDLTRDIKGIGFKKADEVAARLDIPKDSPERAEAAIEHILREMSNNGHVGGPTHDILLAAAELLNQPFDVAAGGLALFLAHGYGVEENHNQRDFIFLANYHDYENIIARRLKTLIATPVNHGPMPDNSAAETLAEEALGHPLGLGQKRALNHAIENKVFILTGNPGTGKTTSLQALLSIFNHADISYRLAAPSGRAAKRMQEATGEEATTIHRMIGWANDTVAHNERNPIEAQAIIIDETSMTDVRLMAKLLLAIRDDSRVIFVGDVDQLPSVGPGKVLKDMIDSNAVAFSHLSEIFRQAQSSLIITNAHNINQGNPMKFATKIEDGDCFFIPAQKPENAQSIIRRLVTQNIPKQFGLDPVDDIQVLSPMKNGELGTRRINNMLEELLVTDRQTKLTVGELSFHVGTKVIQTANDYDLDVYNGDVGRITHIDTVAKTAQISFDDRIAIYTQQKMQHLQHAYAITIHKSQGSEYPAVIIPIMGSHHMMLYRNLLYTGLTRGKQIVVFVGQHQAIKKAIDNTAIQIRHTRLKKLLEN